MFYAAYGSNLNKEQMKVRCQYAVPVVGSTLKDWRLVFRRSYLTIEFCPGEEVPLGIWRISERDEKSLDRYEGYPKFYEKKMIPIDVCGEPVDCLIYVMRDGFPAELPTSYYMEICEHGYYDFCLPVLKLHEAVWYTREVVKDEKV